MMTDKKKLAFLKANNVDLVFNFNFLYPEVLHFDFDLFFPLAKKMDELENMKVGIFKATHFYKNCTHYQDYPEQLQVFVLLIEILGVRRTNKAKKGENDAVIDAIEHFIVLKDHTTTSLDELIPLEGGYVEPYIIYKFDKHTGELHQPYLVVDGVLHMLKSSLNVYEVVDVWYKTFHIFAIEYPTALRIFLTFIDIYVTGVPTNITCPIGDYLVKNFFTTEIIKNDESDVQSDFDIDRPEENIDNSSSNNESDNEVPFTSDKDLDSDNPTSDSEEEIESSIKQ